MPNYGVIDLGSNTIRLVVFEVRSTKEASGGQGSTRTFRSLINDKVMAGLAAYVDDDGVFSEQGVAKAVSVLKGHAKRASYFKCKRLDVFATAVLRNAANCNEAIEEIERGSGLPIALLSARDEAHLGFVGATIGREVDRGTLIDIGGGSTELTRIEGGLDLDGVSLGQGSLSSFASYVRGVIPTPIEMAAIKAALRSRLGKLPDVNEYRAATFYGIGGSVRAAAKMHQQALGSAQRPKSMTKKDIADLLDWCRTDPNSFAHAALKASAERVHTIVPGCIILGTLFEELSAERLEICKYGVREGYLLERML